MCLCLSLSLSGTLSTAQGSSSHHLVTPRAVESTASAPFRSKKIERKINGRLAHGSRRGGYETDHGPTGLEHVDHLMLFRTLAPNGRPLAPNK